MRYGRTEQWRQDDGGGQHGDGAVEGRRQKRRPSRGNDEEETGLEQLGEEQCSKNQPGRRDTSEEMVGEGRDQRSRWANEGQSRGERASQERGRKREEEDLHEEVEREKAGEF